MKLLLSCLIVAAGLGVARAETVVVTGVELTLPAEWERAAKGPITLLHPKKHKGRAIEVIALKQMPPAKPEAFQSLLGGDKLAITSVKEGERDGAKVIVASGKLVSKKGEIAVDVLVVPVKDKATMLVSFVGTDQDPVIQKANTDILRSARVPGPRIKVTVVPPKNAATAPPKELVESIAKIADAFDQRLRLPRPLTITFEDCGMVNAQYQKGKHAIQMCYEMYASLIPLFTSTGVDKAKITETAVFAFLFIFLHEFGHALVGEFDLPITGSSEDAADEIATLILAQNPKSQKIGLAGAKWFESKMKSPDKNDRYWSTHSMDSVRMAAVLCLLFGSDPKGMTPVMKEQKVPDNKLKKCARDAPARLANWKKLLEPYKVTKK